MGKQQEDGSDDALTGGSVRTMVVAKRKVELGSCGRAYGTPCIHEHAASGAPYSVPIQHSAPAWKTLLKPLKAGRLKPNSADGWANWKA